MDFIAGALPNVMFIAGIIAIGIALGIEFKIVEIKGQLSKHGRIGAFIVGAVLIGFSIYLYTKPAQTAAAPTPSLATPAPAAQVNVAAVVPTMAPPVATPLAPTPQGAAQADVPITAEGVIRQIMLQNNQTVVVVNKAVYVFPPELVANLGSSLRVGVNLQLSGLQRSDGTIVVQSVAVSSSPEKKHDDEAEHDD
jgi:hypothetical protein